MGAKIGRKLTPSVRHGPSHYRRKYLPNAGLIVGGVGLGIAGDAIVNEIYPEAEIPIYADGEFSPIHQSEDESFNLFKIVSETEEFEDNSQTFNSTESEGEGDWKLTNLIAMHKGSNAARRVKAACMALVILLILFIMYRIYKRLRQGCRDEGNTKIWRNLPKIMQISPPSSTPTSPPDPTPMKSPNNLYPVTYNPNTPPGLTPQDLELWSTLSAKSRGNLERIIDKISSTSNNDLDFPSTPSSTMFQIQHGLPIGSAPSAPSNPPTARVQVTPAPTHRTGPPQSDGPTGPDADPPSKAGESLARLRKALENSK